MKYKVKLVLDDNLIKEKQITLSLLRKTCKRF